jgi:UDP-glucuronate 4-epimerase
LEENGRRVEVRQRVLITGAAGFIGSHLASGLLSQGSYDLVGLDNFSAPYGGDHCRVRSRSLKDRFGFHIDTIDLSNTCGQNLFDNYGSFDIIIHLAAWPGVRFGQLSPNSYYLNNVNAFGNILDFTNLSKPSKFLFASSSSVYGDLASSGPVFENSATGLNLKSLYAATKWSNEVLAEAYQRITNIPTMALRFFTFYGPNGRPDMAYWHFLESILSNRKIDLFGPDGGIRNFTYIEDAIKIMLALMKVEFLGYRPINIASSSPITTLELLETLGSRLGIYPTYQVITRPHYDVTVTHADTSFLKSLIGNYHESSIDVGIQSFVDWYTYYYLHSTLDDSGS